MSILYSHLSVIVRIKGQVDHFPIILYENISVGNVHEISFHMIHQKCAVKKVITAIFKPLYCQTESRMKNLLKIHGTRYNESDKTC